MKQYILAILFCLPVMVRAQGGKQPRDQRAVDTLPFRMVDGYLIISALASGSPDSLYFIFDTGAEVTTLHEGTAKKLQLSGKQEAGVSGTNNVMIRVGTTTLNVLYLNRARLPFVKVYLENLQEYRKGPLKIDGIIGVDLLKTFIVTIDYVHQRLVLYRSGKTPAGTKGQLVPAKLSFATLVVQALIQLPGGQTLASRYHFITGGEYGILFNWPFVEKYRLNTLLPTQSTEQVQDIFKMLTYTNSAVPYLSVGPHRLENIPVSYSKDVNDAGSISEVAGSIGYSVWRQFRTITVNYNQRELFLEK